MTQTESIFVRYDSHKGIDGANTALLSIQAFPVKGMTTLGYSIEKADNVRQAYEKAGHTFVGLQPVNVDPSLVEALSELSPDLSLADQLTERGLEHATLVDLLIAAKYVKYC